MRLGTGQSRASGWGARARTGAVLAILAMVLGATVGWSQQPRADEDELRDLGAPQGQPLSGVELEARALEIGGLLRCPQCQGLSVADSPVDAAIAMQARVHRLVALGYTEEQILAYFERSYGEFIRLSPKPEGFNLVVWILPVLAVLVGVGVVAWRVRRTGAPAAPAGEDLEEYRRKVREAIGE